MKHSHCIFELPHQIEAACAFYRLHDFVVLLNQAPENLDRALSRASLRASVKKFLAQVCAVDNDKIHLHAEAGQAPYAQVEQQRIYLSFSHDQSYAVAAIHRYQNIGIDLLATPIDFDWRDVARLYLSPVDNQSIADLPDEQQAQRFVVCWAMQEARLKCCSLALQEWSVELGEQLNHCDVWSGNMSAWLPDHVVLAFAVGSGA
jgi:phosphopantetheinyl transferase